VKVSFKVLLNAVPLSNATVWFSHEVSFVAFPASRVSCPGVLLVVELRGFDALSAWVIFKYPSFSQTESNIFAVKWYLNTLMQAPMTVVWRTAVRMDDEGIVRYFVQRFTAQRLIKCVGEKATNEAIKKDILLIRPRSKGCARSPRNVCLALPRSILP